MSKPIQYCEDCKHIMLYDTTDDNLRLAKCGASPVNTPLARVSRVFKQDYEFCKVAMQNRQTCPKFEAKDG